MRNEIMQVCVRLLGSVQSIVAGDQDNQQHLALGFTVMDDDSVEPVFLVDGWGDMAKVAQRSADCEDGELVVNGQPILPEKYCAMWRKTIAGYSIPEDMEGRFEASVTFGIPNWYKDHAETLSQQIGVPVVDGTMTVNPFDRKQMEVIASVYQYCSMFRDGKAVVKKVGEAKSALPVSDLFSMQEAA